MIVLGCDCEKAPGWEFGSVRYLAGNGLAAGFDQSGRVLVSEHDP